jgi:hypothetical protein
MVALSKSESGDEWPKTEDDKNDLINLVVGLASILACALFHGDQARSRLLHKMLVNQIYIFIVLTRNHVCMQNVCEVMVAQHWISTVLNTGFHVRLSEDKYVMKNLLTIHTIATQVRTDSPLHTRKVKTAKHILFLSLSLSHTQTHKHTRTHAHTHTRTLSLPIYLSIYLSPYLSIYLSIYLATSIHLALRFVS